MAALLLTTKLYAPPARPEWVARPRLLARLDEGQAGPLTLVSAPPGFGKTALVADWRARRAPAAAWLSLDAADDEPGRFWRYVLAALQTAQPEVGAALPALLAGPEAAPLEAVAAALVNELAGLAAPLTLILDDYHLITAEAVHASLNFLLDHAPPAFRLIVLTREDPPLALARRRARRQVAEVRAADLRFTDAETNAFLNTVNGLDLPPADLATLAGRTEGWIVGLQMAALLLQDQADRHRLVASFAGDDRYIADFLIEEVLQRQPPAIQTFLCQTAILPRLCGPLCDAVLAEAAGAGRPAAQILEDLERANLFLIPLDNRREWYRYHHLFADLLQARLAQSHSPAAVAGLHRRAAAWFRERGWLIEAVQHLQRAGDSAAVAAWLTETHIWFFANSALPELAAFIQALPLENVAAQPALCFAWGWAALATADGAAALHAMDLIERTLGCTTAALNPAQPPALRANLLEIMVIRAQVAIAQGRVDEALALCQTALPYLTGPDAKQGGYFNPPANLRPVVAYNLAFAQEMQGRTAAAVDAYTEARQLALGRDNVHLIALATGRLGQAQLARGQRRAAEATFRQELRRLAEAHQMMSPLASVALAGLGRACYERNDLEAARPHLEMGFALARTWRNGEGLLASTVGLVRLRLAAGDFAGAEALLDETAALSGQAPPVAPVLAGLRAVVWARQGRREAAEAWVRADAGLPATPLTVLDEDRALQAARVHLAHGAGPAAEHALRRALANAETGGRWGVVLEALVLLAQALAGQERRAEAQAALAQALRLAEPEGCVRVFIDEGPALRPLLAAVAGPPAAYARQLAALIAEPAEPGPPAAPSLAEPLTPREAEVLRLMAAGLSNQEIADKLVISLGTVKTHTANIHGKLGVNTRLQAVNQARALGLL